MRALQEQAERLGRRAQSQRIEEIAADFREQLPADRVVTNGDTVEVSGDGLLRRWLEDASLRFAVARRK